QGPPLNFPGSWIWGLRYGAGWGRRWRLGVASLLMAGAGPASGRGATPTARSVSLAAVEKDIPYAAGGDEQKLDLYLPKNRGFATVVFTYGGGWHRGSRKSVTPIGGRRQRPGFGGPLLSHRLGPKERFPAQIEDVAAAFAWVQRQIARKGGDPARVFLMGHSSGAQLSLLLACDSRYLAQHGLGPKDVAGVVGLSTPVDLEPRKDGKGFGNALMAGRGADVFARDGRVLKTASPIQHLARDLPPVLLVVGERDFPMLEGDNRSFVTKAKALEIRADLFMANGCDLRGVVRSVVEDNAPVEERVIGFLSRRKRHPPAMIAPGRLSRSARPRRVDSLPCQRRGERAASRGFWNPIERSAPMGRRA